MITLFALAQWQSSKKQTLIVEQKNRESNFFLAKSYEEKAMRAIEKGDLIQKEGDKSITEYQKAWLYALEAKKIHLAKNMLALKQNSLVRLTNISSQAISPLKFTTPAQPRMGKQIHDLVYSPNGKLLASASNDKTVQLWNTTTGELKQTLKGRSWGGNAIAFSPNGKLIATTNYKTVQLWSAISGELKQTLKGVNWVML